MESKLLFEQTFKNKNKKQLYGKYGSKYAVLATFRMLISLIFDISNWKTKYMYFGQLSLSPICIMQ